MDQQNIDFKNLFEGLTKGFSEIAAELEKRAAANQLATTVAKDANNNQMNTCPPSIVTSPTVEGDVYNFYGTVNVVVVNNRSSKDSKGFNNSKSYVVKDVSYEKSSRDSSEVDKAWSRFYRSNCYSG